MQGEHSGYGVSGAAADACFQMAAQAHEAGDDQGGVEEDVALRAGRDDGAGGDGRGDAPAPGGAHAQDDQGVHYGRAAAGGVPGGEQDRPAGVCEDGGRCDCEGGEGDVGVPAELQPAVGLHCGEDSPAEDQGHHGRGGDAGLRLGGGRVGERRLVSGGADRVGEGGFDIGGGRRHDRALADQVD